jgi:hypothetical protein
LEEAVAAAGGWARLQTELALDDDEPVPPADIAEYVCSASHFQFAYHVPPDVALAAVIVLDYVGRAEQEAFTLPSVMIREFALQMSTHVNLGMQIWTADELFARLSAVMDASDVVGVSGVNRYFAVWKSWTADFDYVLFHPNLGDVTDVFLRSSSRGGDMNDMFAEQLEVTGVLNSWFQRWSDSPGAMCDQISGLLRTGSPFS